MYPHIVGWCGGYAACWMNAFSKRGLTTSSLIDLKHHISILSRIGENGTQRIVPTLLSLARAFHNVTASLYFSRVVSVPMLDACAMHVRFSTWPVSC